MLKANIYPWHSFNLVFYVIFFHQWTTLLFPVSPGRFEGLGVFVVVWLDRLLLFPHLQCWCSLRPTYSFGPDVWTIGQSLKKTSLLSSTYKFVMINLTSLLLPLSQTYVFDGPMFICIRIFCTSFKLTGL